MPRTITYAALALLFTLAGSTSAFAQQTVSKELLTKDIPEFAGHEVVVSTVEYPPGVASAPHRHDAHTFVYVLEGKVEMQVAGGDLKTLGPGDTFYENTTDIHATSRNASATAPAKIVAFMLKEKAKPRTRPAQ